MEWKKSVISPIRITFVILVLYFTNEKKRMIQHFYFTIHVAFQARPFLYVDDDIDLHVLRQFMINEWKLQSANIVIPVLSGVTNHKPFKNQKMTESLRSGIQNVIRSI